MGADTDPALLDREFNKMTLHELQQQRSTCRTRIQHLQNEISNLAFNNYRTYADVGRMAEHCKDMFAEINQFMTQIKREFPQLVDGVEGFRESSEALNVEYATLDEINSINCYVWELLKFPKLMDRCIRAGKYQTAYALTNFAVNIKQSKLIQNPMIKEVADVLIEARHGLLDELFNKFAGPIDLAKSIQVVNNIRKIPYISNTQLRVSILQYRDIYLEKNVLNISSEPDFALRVIEVYRDCMYDTVVLYMAVFPSSTDFQRKHSSLISDDSRWERWTGGSQAYLLQSWAHRNIERMFGCLRMADAKSALDIETMSGKLMSFAYSFGRMGLDFRSLVLHEFSQLIVDTFRRKVKEAVKCFNTVKKLDLVDGDIFESTLSELANDSANIQSSSSVTSAPLELCIWDDLCVFGNRIIEALNESRHLLAVNYINQIFGVLKEALQALFKWLDECFPKKPNVDVLADDDEKKSGSDKPKSTANELVEPPPEWTKADEVKVRRATRLLFQHFVPFLNKCFFCCFPYEKCGRALFREQLSKERYVEFYSLFSTDLLTQCRNGEFFTQVYDEVSRERPALIDSRSSPTPKDVRFEVSDTDLAEDISSAVESDLVGLNSEPSTNTATTAIGDEPSVGKAEHAQRRPQENTSVERSQVAEAPRDSLEEELENLLSDKNSSTA